MTSAIPDRGGFDRCETCNGQGVSVSSVTVYEPGCAYSHQDTEEHECPECGGTGTVWHDDETEFGVGA